MSTLTGTGSLMRLALRLDRVRLPLWIGGIIVFLWVSAASVVGLYPDAASIAGYVSLMDGNPTLTAVNGPGIGFEDPSVGVVFVNETTIWGTIAISLMAVFLVVRHTRTEEDAERTELLLARRVGRHAPLAASLVVVGGAVLLLGALTVVLLAALGLPTVGSLAVGGVFAGAGLVAMAVAAVSAQVMSTARGALGVAVGYVGVAYVLRAVGDLGTEALSWLSPIGWAHRIRAYAGEDWWVLGLFVGAASLLVTGAVMLSDRRNLGSGIVAQRLGPDRSPRWATSPTGLAWRLQRGTVIGWSIGLFVLGVVYGTVGRDVEQMFEDNPEFEQFLAQMEGASITDTFFAFTLALGAMMACGFAISSVLRIRSEETAGRVESILATSTSRTSWAGSHLLVTIVGVVLVLAASGLGTGLGLALSVDDPEQLPRMVSASLGYVPAVLVLAGLTMLLVGVLPRLSMAAWGLLALVLVVGLFGDLFELPQWARNVSPIEQTPSLPAAPFRPLPVAALVVAALGGASLGLVRLGRRDIPTT